MRTGPGERTLPARVAAGGSAALLAGLWAAAVAADPSALELLRSMWAAADGLRDYTMVLVKQERRGERLEPAQTLLVKWARPQKIYFRALDGPQRGQEVLYAEGWNRGRLRAHRGSFPDLTVNLDPRGSWAMAHTHHPVDEVSLPRFVAIVLDNVERAVEKGVGSVRLAGRETLWGRPCFKLELESPPSGTNRTLQRGETLWDVARAHGQSMYVILHHNRGKGWKGPKSPRPGEAVFVPDFYAGRVELWVDAELRLPIKALIYDHEGLLYERYEHRDLKTNVGLGDLDFDPTNPAYDF